MSPHGDRHEGAGEPGARRAWAWAPADTLRRIVERYPDSTEAEMARMALDGREPPPPVEDEDED